MQMIRKIISFLFDIKNNIIIFVSLIKQNKMKYNELHRILKKAGCYDTGRTMGGHPLWYSPITDKYFRTSHHGSEEVMKGTLMSIKRESGVKF